MFNPTPPCGAPLRAGEQLAVTLVTEDQTGLTLFRVTDPDTQLRRIIYPT